MNGRKNFLVQITLINMFVTRLALRVMFLPANTIAMKVSIVCWHGYIVEHGCFKSPNNLFADYTLKAFQKELAKAIS